MENIFDVQNYITEMESYLNKKKKNIKSIHLKKKKVVILIIIITSFISVY